MRKVSRTGASHRGPSTSSTCFLTLSTTDDRCAIEHRLAVVEVASLRSLVTCGCPD